MESVARTTKTKSPPSLARIGPFPLPVLAVTIAALATALVLLIPHARWTDVAHAPTDAPAANPAEPSALAQVEAAIARGDASAARDEWREAYRSQLRSPDWRRMLALGDAALEIARIEGSPRSGDIDARRAYLATMFRARAAGSIDGVLRATESFATLGDRDVAEEGLRIGDTMAERSGDARIRDRVQAMRARLYGVSAEPEPASPIDSTTWDQGP